jgi:PAS domain S-box-containing protein
MPTHPDARVLGELLAMPALFFVLPNARRIAEFAAQSLAFVPGVSASLLCLFELDMARETPISPVCADCPLADALEPPNVTVECPLRRQSDFYVLPLNSLQHAFGFLVFHLDAPPLFERYAPFLINYAQFIVLTLENRSQNKLLNQTMRRLEADIATRKQIEEELRAKRNSLKEAQRIAHFGNWEWNVRTDVVQASEEVYRILGLPLQESYREIFWQRVHPDDQARLRKALKQCLRARAPPYDLHYRIVRPNGEVRVIHSMGETVRDANGKVLRLIGTLHDVSEQVATEKRLREAVTAAEAANQAKSTFLSNMSHELRTPLNGILGYAQILNQSPDLAPDIREKVATIQHSGEYLLSLINDVLDLAKIEAGHLALQIDSMDLQGMFEDIAHFFSAEAARKDLLFQYERRHACAELAMHGFPLRVCADEKRLRQILLNLLSNALKFTCHGKVDLRVIYAKEYMRVEVEDSGRGIAAADLKNIFQAFQQAGCQRQQQGTGLGLTICRELVTLMGGTLAVRSELGQGSCFYFEIPLDVCEWSDGLALPVGARRQVSASHGGCRRVVVFDPIALNGAVLRDLLTPLGFMVNTAQTTAEFSAILTPTPDIIFMDLDYACADNSLSVAALRNQPDFAQTPIFTISANVFKQEQAQTTAYNAFISQPILLEEVLAVLEKHAGIEWLMCDTPDSAEEILVPLPDKDLKELSELIKMGDILAIIAKLEKLAHHCPPQYQVCCRKLLELANSCNMNRLAAFVQACLAQTVPDKERK